MKNPTKLPDLAEAVRKLIKAKGRFHTEQNYKELADALARYDAGQVAMPIWDGESTLELSATESELVKTIELLTAQIGSQVTVPEQPTEKMLNAARDWSLKKYGQGIGNDAAIGCWKAMLAAAAPSPAKEST